MGLAASFAWSPPGRAAGAGPAEQLRGAIDRVLGVLEDPALKGEGRAAERRRALRQIADEIFDFEETARRAMAQHWRTLTEAQRKEFVELFSDLLERTYTSKIELYGGERIQYRAERIEGVFATVPTQLITK
jgi:phospholipid transport system substrate-binding protein